MRSDLIRKSTYWLLFTTLTLLYLATLSTNVHTSAQALTLIETVATLFTVFIAILAIVLFYSNVGLKFFILGGGLLVMATFDLIHLITGASLFSEEEHHYLNDIPIWSFSVSQLVLAAVFSLILISKQSSQLRIFGSTTKLSFSFILTTVIASAILFTVFTLSQSAVFNLSVYRFVSFIAGLVFFITLIGLLKQDNWKRDYFDHWLVLAIIFSLFTHIIQLATTEIEHKNYLDIAHTLKIFGHICILTGLIINYKKHFNEIETEVGVRKYAQKALEASEIRNRTLMNSLAEGLITISNNGIIENINNSACDLFGYSKLELLGKNIKTLMPEPYHSEHDMYLVRYENTGEARLIGKDRQVSGLKKSGETFPIDLSVSEMIINGVKKYSGIVRDDTQRQKAESEIIESRNKAELAAKAKSEFLATMSHEIRTPMNGVIGMTELLQETPLNTEQKDIVSTISESGNALVRLINDILEISKIEAGKIEFHYSEFNLERAVFDIIKLLKSKADENHVELIYKYHTNCPKTVIGDSGRTRQILLNLIGNAIKFTPYGKVTIDIQCETKDNNTADIKFKIIDTGIGIDEQQKKHLFESFTQADSSTSRKYGGTGLGLSICRQLIELMNGHLDVISEKGKGSTFWFDLSYTLPNQEPQQSYTELKNTKILTLIAEPEIAEHIKDLLSQWGLIIDSARTLYEAIEKIENDIFLNNKNKPALIDHKFLTGDHKETGRNILKLCAKNNIPLLVLVSPPTSCLKIENTLNQSITYITTPILSDKLYNHLLSATGHSNAIKQQQDTSIETQKTDRVKKLNSRILLVEDVIVNQKVAIGIMSSLNFKIDIANNGKEAVDMHKKNDYDLILMDCQMPVMDGYEATQNIRQTDSVTPIIAITANAMSSDNDKCINSGMNDYLSKPYKKNQLIGLLEKWLSHNLSLNNTPVKQEQSRSINNDTVDYSKLDEMKNIMGNVFNELIPAYIEQSDQFVKKMPEAAAEKTLNNLKRYAHSMKSSSLNVGANPLSELSKDLESMCTEKEPNKNISHLIIQIENEYNNVKTSLLNYLERSK